MSDLEQLTERIRRAVQDRYNTLRWVRDDSWGDVCLAVDARLGQTVALRVILRERIPPPRTLDDIATSLTNATIVHPNVLTVHEIIVADGLLIIVREFIEGTTLDRILVEDPRPPLALVQTVLMSIVTALEYAHGLGVLHGHLTESSVIVANDGHVYVTDFGLTTHARDVTAAADQYALGEIAYVLLAGTLPVAGATLEQIVPDVPGELADVVMRMLESDPTDRFDSIADVRVALEAAIDARHGSAKPVYPVRSPAPPPPPPAPRPPSQPAPGEFTALFRRLEVPAPVQPSPAYDENVQFTVYRPRVVRPMDWQPMLAFAHLTEARAGTKDPDPIAVVEHQAKQILEGNIDDFQKVVQDTSQAIPREGTITFVPEMDGVEFNPPRQSFQWLESVHRAEFRLRAAAKLDGTTARGRMTVYHGVIILAELTLSVRVDSAHQSPNAAEVAEPVHARPFRNIFASYSHKDLDVVLQFERFAAAVGDRYLRDSKDLRAGEVWSDALKTLIDQADVLQLFWSWNSMTSPFVRQEWEYALSLHRPNFIRPTYWEDPLPKSPDGSLPPEDLCALQFQHIGLTASETAAEPAASRSVAPGAWRPSTTADFVAPIAHRIATTPALPSLRLLEVTPVATKASAPKRGWSAASFGKIAAVLIAAVGLGITMLSRTTVTRTPNPLPIPVAETPGSSPSNPLHVETIDQVADAYQKDESLARTTYEQRYVSINAAMLSKMRADPADSSNTLLEVRGSKATAHALVRPGIAGESPTLRPGSRARLVCRVDPSSTAGSIQLRDCK